MSKRKNESVRLLGNTVKKVEQKLKMITVNSGRITTEVTQLQATFRSVKQTTNHQGLLRAAQKITQGAQARLRFIDHRSASLNDEYCELNSVMKVASSAEDQSKIMAKVQRLYRSIKQGIIMIKHGMLKNQLALSKMDYLQRLSSLPKRDLGCIKIFYVDVKNNIIKQQTELGRIGSPFNLMAHLTALPLHYHFIKVVSGQHQMVYRASVQRAVIEVAEDRTARLITQSPRVERDAQQPCRIQLIYVNQLGKVIQVHSSLGQKGASFKLRQAIRLPANYKLVKVISGLNVRQYRRREQLIELEIKPSKVKSKPRINANQVRQAFLDYYNAHIMNVAPRASTYSGRFGYYCSKQYLAGIADAYHNKSLREGTPLYRRGYQVYRHSIIKKQVRVSSFSDVLLKIYQVVIQDAALLSHDLKRDAIDF